MTGRAPPRQPPALLFHDARELRAGLRAAAERDVEVIACSAPGVAAALGVDLVARIVEAARREVSAARLRPVIDCGDDAALAMAALDAGWTRLVFSGHREARAKLAAIARRHRAEVWAKAPPGLDLGAPAEPLEAARAYLQGAS